MQSFRLRVLVILALIVLWVTLPVAGQTEVDCTVVLEIWQIQGDAEDANCPGIKVTTENNVVTAIGPNGFFMQTPDSRVDENEATSNGIYVITNRHPGLMDIAVGDMVHVTGKVEEFFQFTRLDAPTRSRITVVSSGNLLPDPIDLTSVDFTVFDGEPHPLERYEGMLVQVVDGVVNAPTNQFDEFGITLTGERAFREQGIEPDQSPELADGTLPEWDLNPELVEVDPLEMGMPVIQLSTGARANVTGALAYSFLDYQIWTTSLDVIPFDFEARPVRDRQVGEFTIATQNVENLFDLVDDPNRRDGPFENWTPVDEEGYQLHLSKLSQQIRLVLGAPDILAIQEIENTRTLTDLALQLYEDDPSLRYTGCLLEGNEGRGIDVAYLVRTDHVNMLDCYRVPGSLEATYNDGDFLFTRPPLVLEAEFIIDGEAFPITLINVHIRSLNDVEEDRVQIKRLGQATMIAEYVQQRLQADPDIHLVVLGDFNAFQFSDGLVDVVGIIAGTHHPSEARMAPETDIVEPNLLNQVLRLPHEEQYSYIWNSNAQVLDHILTSSALDTHVVDVQYGRGNADVPIDWLKEPTGSLRSSDHDGLVIFVKPE